MMTSAPSRLSRMSPNTCWKLDWSRSPKSTVWRVGVGGKDTLGPRPSLQVEDDAAAALRADEPLAAARVTEAEGAAPDRADGHRRAAARAGRPAPGREGFADGTLLLRLVLRVAGTRVRAAARLSRAGHGATRSTTFPKCSPDASRWYAWRPSSIGHTESTVGRRRPARSAAVTASSSASLPIVEPMMLH